MEWNFEFTEKYFNRENAAEPVQGQKKKAGEWTNGELLSIIRDYIHKEKERGYETRELYLDITEPAPYKRQIVMTIKQNIPEGLAECLSDTPENAKCSDPVAAFEKNESAFIALNIYDLKTGTEGGPDWQPSEVKPMKDEFRKLKAFLRKRLPGINVTSFVWKWPKE